MSILTALWLPGEGNGQTCPNLVQEGDLIASIPVSDYYNSFFNGAVPNWYSSLNSPHHVKVTETINGPTINYLCLPDEERNCLYSSNIWNEGIFTNISIKRNMFLSYDFQATAQLLKCGGESISVRFALGNELINGNSEIYTSSGNDPEIFPMTVFPVSGYEPVVLTVSDFRPIKDYSQFELLATNGNGSMVSFSDISIQCHTTALTVNLIQSGPNFQFFASNGNPSAPFVSYHWDFGDGTIISNVVEPNHVYTNPGTYDVRLYITDSNGCCGEWRSSVGISCETPVGHIDVKGDCPTFDFTILGGNNNVAGVSYLWDFDDDDVESPTDDGKFVSYTYTEGGQFTVTCVVTNACGESAEFTTQVTVDLPVPSFTVTDNCPSYTFMAPLVNGYMYLWDFGDGSTNGTGNMVNHSYNSNGIKEVKLTVTNSCGSVSITQNVEVNCIGPSSSCSNQSGCITIGTDINSQIRLSDLINGTNPIIPTINGYFGTRVIQGGCYSLKGRLIIDVMTDMRNTQWYCGPGATIEVKTWLFSATESVFQGCDQMWRGFIVPPSDGFLFGYGIALEEATIRDAWRGVELGNVSAITAQNCKFIDNYIGIRFGLDNSQSNNIYNKISTCSFESQYTMLPAFTGQITWSTIMEKGIDANGVGLLNVFSENNVQRGTFKNVKIGIHAKSSNLTIEENNFIHETPISNGYGILCQNMSGIANITNDNHFTNIYRSIEFNGGQRAAINIAGNVFESQLSLFSTINHKGIYVVNHPISAVTIQNNNFNYVRGIDVDVMGGLSYLDIINNDFYTNGVMNVPMVIKNVHTGSKIIDNDFYNTGLYIVNQTQMRDCSLFEVQNNISHESSSDFSTMFYLEGANKCIFRNNRIENEGIQFDVNGSEIVTGNGYCCNSTTMDEGDKSMLFSDPNGETKVRQNTIRYLELGETGDIGSQLNAGNIWLGANSLAKMLGATEQKAQDNRFTISQGQEQGTPESILTEPVDVSSIWFNSLPINAPNCNTHPECDLQPYFSGPYNPYLTIPEQDTSGVVPLPSQDCYAFLHSLDHALLLKSSSNPKDQIKYWNALIQLDYWVGLYGEEYWSDCIEWKDILDEQVKEWIAVDNEIKKLEKSFDPETEIACGHTMQLLKDAIGNATGVNPYDIPEITQQVKQTYEEISLYHTKYQSYINQGRFNGNAEAGKLKARVGALSAPYAFLEGRKLVWSVMLQKFQNGLVSITSTEWDDVAKIAAKCPSEGGQAVYEAINLLEHNGTYVTVNRSCNPTTPRSKNEILDQILVYPNPTTGVISIEIPDGIKADELFVYNLQGKVVYLSKITGNGTIIHLNFLEPGIYFYSLTNNNRKITDGKLVLIK